MLRWIAPAGVLIDGAAGHSPDAGGPQQVHQSAKEVPVMVSPRRSWIGFVLLCLAFGLAPVQAASPAARARPTPARSDGPQALATRIDQLITARWAAKNVVPASPAEDPEFLRRVYLDLAGRVPRVSEVRDFLDDSRPDKRRRLVEWLLASPSYVNNFGNLWSDLLLSQGNQDQLQYLKPAFESWLRKQLEADTPYDKLVREVLAGSVAYNNMGEREGSALAFYQANEMKPENLAASTSRLFLGVKLECAQCHKHPFAKWSRKQFWQFAAFFAGVQSANGAGFGGVIERKDRRQLKIGGTDKVVEARFLDDSRPDWKKVSSPRVALADWVTSPANPYFTRNIVNRVWAHFFGVGIVDPIDDLDPTNPASHPELLDELARQFVEHRYDVKYLIRAITSSRTYQLSSAVSHPSQADPRLFARVSVKGLTAEQLFDSLATATGYHDGGDNPRLGFIAGRSVRREFLTKFASKDRPTETQTTILQALALMNGQFTADATSLELSETLAAVADAPFLDSTSRRVEVLFLATLSRKPRPGELERFVKYVDRKRAGGKDKAALADVFWALLNSSEFILNH
jgi:hypothetical protein